jgi:recombination protein RecT
MAKKTVLKRVLKYCPLRSDFVRGVVQDESIKSSISADMYEVNNEIIYEAEFSEVDEETGEVTNEQ